MKHLMVQLSQWEEYIRLPRRHWSGDTKQQKMNSVVWNAAEVRNLASHGMPAPELPALNRGHKVTRGEATQPLGKDVGRWFWASHAPLSLDDLVISTPTPNSCSDEISSSYAASAIFQVWKHRDFSPSSPPLFIWQPLWAVFFFFFSIAATLLRAIRPMVTSCLQYFLCFEICIVVKRWGPLS